MTIKKSESLQYNIEDVTDPLIEALELLDIAKRDAENLSFKATDRDESPFKLEKMRQSLTETMIKAIHELDEAVENSGGYVDERYDQKEKHRYWSGGEDLYSVVSSEMGNIEDISNDVAGIAGDMGAEDDWSDDPADSDILSNMCDDASYDIPFAIRKLERTIQTIVDSRDRRNIDESYYDEEDYEDLKDFMEWEDDE